MRICSFTRFFFIYRFFLPPPVGYVFECICLSVQDNSNKRTLMNFDMCFFSDFSILVGITPKVMSGSL